MNKYKKLLPLRIISIIFAGLILFFIFKNHTPFQTDAKSAYAMFFTAAHPVTSLLSYKLLNAALIVASVSVIIMEIAAQIMCTGGKERYKNDTAGLILDLGANIIAGVSCCLFFILMPFAAKAGVDPDSVGFVAFIAAGLFWSITAIMIAINYEQMARKYRHADLKLRKIAITSVVAVLIVSVGLEFAALIAGNSGAGFGIYGQEKRVTNQDFFDQASNSFNGASVYGGKVYFYDFDVTNSLCSIDAEGNMEYLDDSYKMVESSPLCRDNDKLFYIAKKDGEDTNYLVQYNITSGETKACAFVEADKAKLFNTFLGTRDGYIYFITTSASDGWYDIRRTPVSDNTDPSVNEIYAPHVVYSNSLYPCVIGNTGVFDMTGVAAPYSSVLPTVSLKGDQVYFVERKQTEDGQDYDPVAFDLCISNSDGNEKQVLHTFEDMEVVKIFVADGYVVYEYTTDDGFAYAVTAV